MRRINATFEVFTAACLAMMVLLVFFQIITRAILGSSLAWSGELARYLMVWITFLGASFAFQYGAHVSVNYFIQKFPIKLANIIVIVTAAVTATFLIVLFREGIKFMHVAQFQKASALGISMSYVYSIIPISSVLILLNLIDYTINNITAQKVDRL